MVTFSFEPSAMDSDTNQLRTMQAGDSQRYCVDHRETEKSREKRMWSTSANLSPFSRARIRQVHIPWLLFYASRPYYECYQIENVCRIHPLRDSDSSSHPPLEHHHHQLFDRRKLFVLRLELDRMEQVADNKVTVPCSTFTGWARTTGVWRRVHSIGSFPSWRSVPFTNTPPSVKSTWVSTSKTTHFCNFLTIYNISERGLPVSPFVQLHLRETVPGQ